MDKAVDLIVRAARPADAEAIARIYAQGIEERIATFETAPRSTDDMLAYLAERDGRYSVLVAERDHRVVAWTAAGSYRARECYAGVCEFSVYADRAVRGSDAAQAGFREVGTSYRHAKLDGEWRDTVIVERLFGEAALGS